VPYARAGPCALRLHVRSCQYYIGVWAPSRFETFHLQFWPLLLVAATSLMFLGYARWAENARGRP